MEGRLCELDTAGKKGKVDTRNDQLGELTIYFRTIPEGLAVDATVEFDVVTSKFGTVYAKFRSVVKRNQVQFNTEDREKWYDWGGNQEEDFAAIVSKKTGRDIRVNPEKDTCPWAIDLYDYTAKRPADLKTRNTPFFTAGKYRREGIPYNPAFTVTFNRKDYEHYRDRYPDCDIYFWINWKQTEYGGIKVPHVNGIWWAPFSEMAKRIENGQVAHHAYLHRKNDDHNAKDSYLFDLSDSKLFTKIM